MRFGKVACRCFRASWACSRATWVVNHFSSHSHCIPIAAVIVLRMEPASILQFGGCEISVDPLVTLASMQTLWHCHWRLGAIVYYMLVLGPMSSMWHLTYVSQCLISEVPQASENVCALKGGKGTRVQTVGQCHCGIQTSESRDAAAGVS